MRKIDDGLYGTPKKAVADFIEQQCKDDGGRKSEKDIIETDENGVAKNPREIETLEKLGEIGKTHPWAAHDPLGRLEVLEGDQGSVHRHIAENDIVRQPKDGQEVDIAVAQKILPQHPPVSTQVFRPQHRTSP